MICLRLQMARSMRSINQICERHPEFGGVIGGPLLERLTDSPVKRAAIEALEAAGYVSTLIADNELAYIRRLKKSSLYLLERRELWFNRVLAFASGVAAALICEAIIRALF